MAETKTLLPQDTCIFDSDSFDSSGRVVTNDMILTPAFDFSDATNSPELILQNNSFLYGSVTLCSDMTFTGPSNASNVYIVQRDKNISITCAGVGFPCHVIVSTIGRTVTFNDDFILPDNRTLGLANGTITTDNDVIVGRVRRHGGELDMGDAVLNMGSGTWYITMS